jgi:hypothetical protein
VPLAAGSTGEFHGSKDFGARDVPVVTAAWLPKAAPYAPLGGWNAFRHPPKDVAPLQFARPVPGQKNANSLSQFSALQLP